MPFDPSIPFEIQRWLQQLDVRTANPFSGGGLSGARIWRCTTADATTYCLREWPTPHPNPQRLATIHAAMQAARQQGLHYVPALLRYGSATFVTIAGKLWEVTEWMRGEANYLVDPQPEKLWSAITALAELHRTWFQLDHQVAPGSPAVTQRVELLERWLSDGKLSQHELARQLECAQETSEYALVQQTLTALRLHGPALLAQLKRLQAVPVMLQPVLRDIWSDHVLYVDHRVTGIIDYGAMKRDEPATDLARLLGSLEPFDAALRREAVERYNELQDAAAVKIRSVRGHEPLLKLRANCDELGGKVEWERVDLLDRSGSLLTALQWAQWLVLERRQFSVDTAPLRKRWQVALARLDHPT